jgi:hypothetical protein
VGTRTPDIIDGQIETRAAKVTLYFDRPSLASLNPREESVRSLDVGAAGAARRSRSPLVMPLASEPATILLVRRNASRRRTGMSRGFCPSRPADGPAGREAWQRLQTSASSTRARAAGWRQAKTARDYASSLPPFSV